MLAGSSTRASTLNAPTACTNGSSSWPSAKSPRGEQTRLVTTRPDHAIDVKLSPLPASPSPACSSSASCVPAEAQDFIGLIEMMHLAGQHESVSDVPVLHPV